MDPGDIESLNPATLTEVKRLDVDEHAYTVTQGDDSVTLLASEMRRLLDTVEDDFD